MPGTSLLSIKRTAGGTSDTLLWKWLRGEATSGPDFGTPYVDTDYALCVYSGAPELKMSVVIPRSATKWHLLNAGYRYKDSDGSASGVQKIILKAGAAGRSKLQLLGRGPLLPDPDLQSIAAPVRVQFVNGNTGTCWESRFEATDVFKQDAEKLRAKSSN